MKKFILGIALLSIMLLGMSPVRISTHFISGNNGFLETQRDVHVTTVVHDNHELIITTVFAAETVAVCTIHKPNCSFCKGKAERQ